jgi:hypothetical protein
MSNTAVVTPVAGITTTIIGRGMRGIAAVATWLCQETEQDRKAGEEYREARRRELLENPTHTTDLKMIPEALPQFTWQSLCISNPETLVQSAQRLGYRLEPLVDAKKPLKHQPHIFLQKPSGERLAISYNEDRLIVLTKAGGDSRLRHLVRQHTLDCALEHLEKKGMRIQTAVLSNGEAQIFAREKTDQHQDGLAQIRAQLNNDGTAWIDVDHLQSNRCREIVQDFADAIGGQVTEMKMKVVSFQLPGEPAKTSIKV